MQPPSLFYVELHNAEDISKCDHYDAVFRHKAREIHVWCDIFFVLDDDGGHH